MPEKIRTSFKFDKELYLRAKHYVIDKHTNVKDLLESLLRKELDENGKNKKK